MTDYVHDDELLYRAIRKAFVIEMDGKLRCGVESFRDPERKPSVDRAKLLAFRPYLTRRDETDAVGSLVARAVRALHIVQRSGPKGNIEFVYQIDVIPDPIRNDPELPDNPAHAKICAVPDIGSNAFQRLKEELADLTEIVLPPDTIVEAPSE
jgi:hypothetical protein